jgi:DNA-binding transcriptional ArsR family regulator
MARSIALSAEDVARALRDAGPAGLTPEALEGRFPEVSRSTLTRRLKELADAGAVKARGQARSVRYVAATDYTVEDVRRYFETDWQDRPLASFQEALLLPTPGIDPELAGRLAKVQARARSLDKKFLSDFLIDFSWASSVLEGSTYSNIDTQALIEYGERNQDKPVEDAVLILNHKNAIQFLWSHRDITTENICAMQAFLTDGHDLPEVVDSEHFLPSAQRGVPREFEEVRLGRSAYSPAFRPGTGFIAKAFEEIVATAQTLPPVQAAFYLMTRIPYLQVFVNGNKRTSRLAANLPLLQAGLLPISFVDFRKAEYVLGMSAFYELGDTQFIQKVFTEGYLRSIVRGSDLPGALRVAGLKIEDLVETLVAYVRTGRAPKREAQVFLSP